MEETEASSRPPRTAIVALLAGAVSAMAMLLSGCGEVGLAHVLNDAEPDYASADLIVSGTLVTMDDALRVLPGGAVVISEGTIIAVLEDGDPLPEEAQGFPTVALEGFVFPGLINPHNHLAYNVLPPWKVPLVDGQPLSSVYDWRYGDEDGYAGVRESYLRAVVRSKNDLMRESLAGEAGKWAEMKELAAGTTTTQGSYGFRASDEEEDAAGFRFHLVRNLDLDAGATRQSSVGIYERYGTEVNDWLLRGVLADVGAGETKAFLVHLSEGRDDASVRELYDLNDFERDAMEQCGPLMPHTAVVHGTAYGRDELALLAQCGADLIAAPLSNLLYYGIAPDLPAAVAEGVNVSLSTDWSVAGSRNLLEELKVVDYLNRTLWGGALAPVDVVRMVTRNPAEAIGWGDRAGQIRPGFYGDLAALRTDIADPYRALIEATEREVSLVVIGGEPLFGGADVLATLKPMDHETVDSGCGFVKAIDVTTQRRPVEEGRQALGEIRDQLVRGFRAVALLRAETPPPLFTCADVRHFGELEDSGTLAYFLQSLDGLPAFLRGFYDRR